METPHCELAYGNTGYIKLIDVLKLTQHELIKPHRKSYQNAPPKIL